MPCLTYQRSSRRQITVVAAFAVALFISSCTRPPWPPDDDSGYDIVIRLNEREEEIESATYRVRWEAIGTNPHGTILMDIAYKSPDKFHVEAEGPFGLPSFTAVLVGDSFWYVDHRTAEKVNDHLDNLDRYDVPMSEFFADQWRQIFSGGWGGGHSMRALTLGMMPARKRNEYELVADRMKWTVNWDHGNNAPRRIRAETVSDSLAALVAEIEYKNQGDKFPYWEIKGLSINGLESGGEHLWSIRRQKYNLSLPDRLFEPLKKPDPPVDR